MKLLKNYHKEQEISLELASKLTISFTYLYRDTWLIYFKQILISMQLKSKKLQVSNISMYCKCYACIVINGDTFKNYLL